MTINTHLAIENNGLQQPVGGVSVARWRNNPVTGRVTGPATSTTPSPRPHKPILTGVSHVHHFDLSAGDLEGRCVVTVSRPDESENRDNKKIDIIDYDL